MKGFTNMMNEMNKKIFNHYNKEREKQIMDAIARSGYMMLDRDKMMDVVRKHGRIETDDNFYALYLYDKLICTWNDNAEIKIEGNKVNIEIG